MTNKERVIATINGEKTDHLPFHSDLTSVAKKNLPVISMSVPIM